MVDILWVYRSRRGQKVKFDVKEESRGPKAVNVEVIEG